MKYTVAIVLSLLSSTVFAQEYGDITQDEINYKTCAFDKSADAVIFLDKAMSTHDDQALITKRRIKFKILKESGIENGNLRIVYRHRDDFEIIDELEAYVYNVNDQGSGYKKTELDKKSIFREKINEYYTAIKIALPEIKIGSIVEYQYTSKMKNYGGLGDWFFQEEIPTLLSQYDLTMLPGAAFSYKVIKSPTLHADVKYIEAQGRTIFEMRNIPGLRDEPYMDAPRDYLQRVVFQLSEYQTYYGARQKYANTWADLARDLLQEEDFGRVIEKNVKGSDEVLTPIKAKSSEFEKMVSVFSYVQKNLSWNRINSKYAGEGLKKVWEKKSGTSGEINLLLINFLKEVKLDAQPLLVSERDHGKVDGSYPFVDQFNKVVALVIVNGKRYILDATDQTTPIDMIPFDLLNTNAFLVVKKSNAVIPLSDNTRTLKNFTVMLSFLDEEGKMNGEVNVYSYDYSRLNRMPDLKKNSEKDFITHYFQKEVSNIEIDSIVIKNRDTDSLPLEQKFHYSTSMPSTGDYRMVNLNLFGAHDKSPFVSDNRFTNINFGCQVNNTLTQVLKIPAGMKPEALPKSINLIMPDNSITFSRVMQYDAATNTITSQVKYQVTRTLFVPEEYPSVKDFYKKMVDMLNEPLVLKKK